MEAPPKAKLNDLIEVAVSYALILATIWSAHPVRERFGWVAVSWLTIVLLIGAPRAPAFGLGLCGIRQSLWAVAVALVAALLSIWCAATLGTLHFQLSHRPFPPPMMGYLVWSFVQQFVLQNIFLSRLLRLLGRPSMAICAAGLMLSMAHLPNLLLVFATLFWGVGACWLFSRYRNLYSVALIHFLLGLTLAVCVPSSLHHNMRVGRGYARYHVLSDSSPHPRRLGLALHP